MKESIKIMFSALVLAAALSTARSVSLAWDASPGTNVITNYKVYYGVAHATYTNSVSAGPALTVSISNLVAGATYYFVATATGAGGLESDFSTEIFTVITNKVTVLVLAPSALRYQGR